MRRVEETHRIREANRKARIAWCRGNRYKTINAYWNRVIFSDECKIDIGTDNRVFIWRRVREEWMPCCLSQPPTPKFSLMVWGCITFDGVGTITVIDGIVNAQRYIDILEAHCGLLLFDIFRKTTIFTKMTMLQYIVHESFKTTNGKTTFILWYSQRKVRT